MYGDWFYTTSYAIFTIGSKATKRSPPDDVGRWVITRSRLNEKHSDEKLAITLLIVGDGLIAYHLK